MTARRTAAGSWLVAPAILFVVAILLGLLVRGPAGPFDLAISASVIAASPPWLPAGGELIGSLPVVAGTAILAAVASLWGRRAWAVAFVVGLAVEVPVEALKLVIDRARPITAKEIEAFGSTASYPSGHVARVVVLGGLLAAWLLWRRGRVAWVGMALAGVVAGLVAVARIAAGVHWPTDVVGGVLVGTAWLLVALHVAEGGAAS